VITRSFANGFQVADWTQELVTIPNTWGTIGQLGLFSEDAVSQHVVYFEEQNFSINVVGDRTRGTRNNQNAGQSRKIHTFSVPHFPLDDYISPQDLQGQRAYAVGGANPENVETLDLVRARKMVRIRKNHAITLEYARAQLITAGTVYAPNGTVVQDWNAEFGVTRHSIDFLLGTSTTDVMGKIEEGIAYIQDNANGETVLGTLVLCSPEFFQKLISHPRVQTAYQYYMNGNQQPLRDRLAAAGILANAQATQTLGMHRVFDYGGTVFLEMRDALPVNGTTTRLLSANSAYMIPTGTTETFKTWYSPANRFEFVNTLGEPVYMFETQDPNGTKIDIQTETNFVNGTMRPQLIVNLTTSN
jgi:hypothetical protein